MLLRGLLCLVLGLLPLSVLAALDDKDKIANRTIERVCSLVSEEVCLRLRWQSGWAVC